MIAPNERQDITRQSKFHGKHILHFRGSSLTLGKIITRDSFLHILRQYYLPYCWGYQNTYHGSCLGAFLMPPNLHVLFMLIQFHIHCCCLSLCLVLDGEQFSLTLLSACPDPVSVPDDISNYITLSTYNSNGKWKKKKLKRG